MSLPQIDPRSDLHDDANVKGDPGLDAAAREALAARLARQITTRIGVTAQVLVLAPGGLERSVGKARRIVDERDLRP